MSDTKKAPTPAEIRALADAEYLADEANPALSFPYSPAEATKRIAAALSIPYPVGIVAEAYYAGNGRNAPLDIRSRAKDGRPTPASIRAAVRKRRDGRGRLGRWEVVGYALDAALGVDPGTTSAKSLKALYAEAGGDLDASYTGRGTRAGAPATRASASAEIDATL